MYEEFYKLNHRPFLTAPDPSFLYWTDEHINAYTVLRYSILARTPIAVVTGEIGAGKTTLIRKLLSELPKGLRVGLISNMQGGKGDLLTWILFALGEPFSEGNYVEKFGRFQEVLLRCYGAGERVILIIDEAQNLDCDTLEELRMLSNINSERDEIIQIILVGQPQLRALLSRPELTQFAQRIAAEFDLRALTAGETDDYIQHRLSLAGASWRIFPQGTCALVHKATRGVPRLINILCDMCLVYGFAAESKVIEEGVLREFLSSSRERGIYSQFTPLDDAPKIVRKAALRNTHPTDEAL